MDLRHYSPGLRQMRHMRGSAYVKLGFHTRVGGLSIRGKESQFSDEEFLVFLPIEVDKWKTGFLYIAYGAKVPILLGVIDYSRKHIQISQTYQPTGDVDADMKAIRDYYSEWKHAARYPDKFIP